MGLKDFEVLRDKFEEDSGFGPWSFPCNCCKHRHKNDFNDPCRICDHNVNSIEE